MTEQQLIRALNSIGKRCFVTYYEAFKNLNNSTEQLIELLMQNESYEESGCKTRISQSRRIFLERKETDALDIIIESIRLEPEIIHKAKLLREKSNTPEFKSEVRHSPI